MVALAIQYHGHVELKRAWVVKVEDHLVWQQLMDWVPNYGTLHIRWDFRNDMLVFEVVINNGY